REVPQASFGWPLPLPSRKMRLSKHYSDGVACYQQFFVSGYNITEQSRSVSRDCTFRAARRLVPLSIQPEASPFQAAADLFPNGRRVLANPAGKNQCISPAHTGKKRANVFPCAITEDIDRDTDPVILME